MISVSIVLPGGPRSLREELLVFLTRRREHAPAHYHACPECYEHEACTLDCTIEPDLGEHRGCAIGAHDRCSSCRRRP